MAVVIEMEVDKSLLTKSALIVFIALSEYLLIRKINSLE
jgi:hypothetical protein